MVNKEYNDFCALAAGVKAAGDFVFLWRRQKYFPFAVSSSEDSPHLHFQGFSLISVMFSVSANSKAFCQTFSN